MNLEKINYRNEWKQNLEKYYDKMKDEKNTKQDQASISNSNQYSPRTFKINKEL